MTITRSNIGPDVVLSIGRTFFHQKTEQLRDALARRKTFQRTYHELSVLTDRDLADLGIVRADIKKLAQETAYDL